MWSGLQHEPVISQEGLDLLKSSKLYIFDVDYTVLERFVEEVAGQSMVTIALNAREIADKSVGRIASIQNGVCNG